MAKDFAYIELFEQYKSLLTEKQQKIFNDYFLLDLSLGEIAEMNGISRQSVNDTIKKAKEQLMHFETVLKNAERYEKSRVFLEKLKDFPELYQEFVEIIKD